MEKNCTWHFKPEGGGEIGPNDPLHITFKGNPYYSIVREAIQNSLDAINDTTKPVEVAFKYFDLDRQEYPAFFKIEDNITQCLEYYSENTDAKRLFDEMLKYLNGTEEGKKKLKISCLRISDANTKGMYFDEGTTSPFYAFLRASGVSSKNQGAGGSFGFGKGAYFALSPIKTLIVSSKDIDENVYFEGATRLTTHKDKDGNKRSAFGFYDNNQGNPITEKDNIPEIFRRAESGTDVNIIGLWNEPNRKRLMIKSVLNNFWLAIYDEKLTVQIDEVLINKANIETIIDEYFEGQAESGTPSEIESWNPKSYLKAVKYAGINGQFRVFEQNLVTAGKVKLYIYLEKGLPNRTSYFRIPKMVVFKRTNRKVNGYSAVFICDNKKGNEMLRLMENPAHNEWNVDNYPKNEGQVNTEARKVLNEISNFINTTLESLSKTRSGEKIKFIGLEEYLSIPEDLLEKDEEYEFDGLNSNNFSDQSSREQTEDETGSITSTKDSPVNINPTVKVQQSEVTDETDIEATKDGEEIILTGGENDTSGGDAPSDGPGNTENAGSKTDDSSGTNKIIAKVNFKVAAQIENGHIYHYLIINSINEIENAELELFVGADNDRDDGIEIKEVDKGIISKNTIKDLQLGQGVTKIKIRFDDNVKHSVKLKAYEIQ
ncbi:hypothetical protein H8B06_20335 [Sphingobacterium sp. DN00404]|uniref:ATPase n=1 Tax=Sphingobacterium micropteri TaxID=2763501 RepID=A0ABR7YV04_9SPHI|nr:hypothetical protein [Sphingobacterium micropteri]MBD1435179.1 hypothetical protein [Sphingobacterium micropteri]